VIADEYSDKMVGYILYFHTNISYHGQVAQTTTNGNTHPTYRKNRTASEWQEISYG